MYPNKLVSKSVEDFLINAKTGSITRTEYGTSCLLMELLEEKKKVFGYLKGLGMDPFKRGTKEPARIADALSKASWAIVKDSPEFGRSMFD